MIEKSLHPKVGAQLERLVSLELTSGATEALRRRLMACPLTQLEDLQVLLQRRSEQRTAITKDGEQCVSLLAMPVILSSDQAVIRARARFEVLGSDKMLWNRLRSLWTTMLGPGYQGKVIPLSSAIHLNEVLGVSPDKVHACVVKGASALEAGTETPAGRLPAENESREHPAAGPIPAIYLYLAYAVHQAGERAPACSIPRTTAIDAQLLLAAMHASQSQTPSVSLLPPASLYDALEAAHAAQLSHIAAWNARGGTATSIEVTYHEEDRSQAEVVVCYVDASGNPQRVCWRYECTWRSRGALQRSINSANATASLVRQSLERAEDAWPNAIGLARGLAH